MRKLILIYMYMFVLFSSSAAAFDISADSACLIAAETGVVIYSKNENKKMPMASTTKIMTALLAAESGKSEDIVTVSKNAEKQEGSSIYLRNGEKIKLSDLTLGLMLNSGNDAAVAIAEHLSGSCENFAAEMNKKAAEIGVLNTSFKNPNGLDEPGHYTTAYDLATISAYAMKNDMFRDIVSKKTSSVNLQNGQILYFSNHNKLLKMYDGAIGIKTGFTKNSGRCLVSAAERDGILLIAVTLNAPDDWNDHKKMLDLGFEKVFPKKLVSQNQILKSMTYAGLSFDFAAANDVILPFCGNEKFDIVLHMPKTPPVPINKGEKAGFAEVFCQKKLISEFDIISVSDIKKQTSETNFKFYLKRTIAFFLKLFNS